MITSSASSFFRSVFFAEEGVLDPFGCFLVVSSLPLPLDEVLCDDPAGRLWVFLGREMEAGVLCEDPTDVL